MDDSNEGTRGWWSQAQGIVTPALELLMAMAPSDLGSRAEAWAPLAGAARQLAFTSLGLVGRARTILGGGDLSKLGDLLDEAGAVLVEDLTNAVNAFPDVAEVILGAEAIERLERSILSNEASRELALDALRMMETRADVFIGRLLDVILSPSTPEEISRMAGLLERLEATAQRVIDEVIVPRVERAAASRWGGEEE